MLKSQKNKLTFRYEENDNPFGHTTELKFSIDPDATLEEIHSLCKTFVKALGYGEKNVEALFGEDGWYDKPILTDEE